MYTSRRDYIIWKDIELWRKLFLNLLLNDVVSATKVTYNNLEIRTIKWQSAIEQQLLGKKMLAKYIAKSVR